MDLELLKRKEKMYKPKYWTTEREIDHLEGVGTYGVIFPLPRHVVLKNYLDSMWMRTNWCDVDPLAIKEYIEKELNRDTG